MSRAVESQKHLTERDSGPWTEPEGFKVFYDRFHRPIYNFFANRGFSPDECQDLVQDTFLRVYRNASGFRGDSGRTTWLFSIAKNVWLEVLRHRSRDKRNAIEVSLEAILRDSRLNEWQKGSEEQLGRFLKEERAMLLRDALEELPPQMQCCLKLRIGQELKYREIAEVMQISIGTVKSQLSEARERLKHRLSEHFAEA